MTDPLNERPHIVRPSYALRQRLEAELVDAERAMRIAAGSARIVTQLADALQSLRNAAVDSARSGAFTGSKGRALEQAIRDADRLLTNGSAASAIKNARRAVAEHG